MRTEEPNKQVDSEREKKKNFTISFKSIFIWAVILFLIATTIFLFTFKKFNVEEKEFIFTGCMTCKQDGCIDNKTSIGFKVTSSNVLIFHKSEGMERILALQNNDETKCTILKDRNFAFQCDTLRTLESVIQQSTVNFDGKNTYEMSNETLMGNRKIKSKNTCLVVEK